MGSPLAIGGFLSVRTAAAQEKCGQSTNRDEFHNISGPRSSMRLVAGGLGDNSHDNYNHELEESSLEIIHSEKGREIRLEIMNITNNKQIMGHLKGSDTSANWVTE